jgi:hypothetical protein
MGTQATSGCESFSWSVRLSDTAPTKRYAVLAVAIAAGLLGFALFRHPLFGLLGFAMIFGATTEYWLGSRYEIGPNGVSARTGVSVTSMRWDEAKRIEVRPTTICVSPLETAGRMDAFRGVTIRTTAECRARVIEIIRACSGKDVRILGQ